jgi:hypothetical protein
MPRVAGIGSRRTARSLEGPEIVKGDLDKAGWIGSEGIAELRIARRHRETGVAVVAAAGGDDALAGSSGAGDLDGKIDGLTAADAEDDPGQAATRGRGKSLGELCTPARDQVVVTDVERVEGLSKGRHDPGMTVAEVEDAAVAVAVDEATVDPGVDKCRSFTGAHHHIEIELAVHCHLAGIDVASEGVEGRLAFVVGLRRCGHSETPVS